MSESLLSTLNRDILTEKLTSQTYDLIVIGGGITGAGIALDAASRGLKTALVEKRDFASGTSSRSTKLIHGGLRYLKQFEIALVREVGRERAIVHKLAPHLVTSEKMILPLIKGGTYGKLATYVGLMVYDILAGVEKPDQRIMLDKSETLEAEPLLSPDILEGSGLYAEYRTDDARLTIEIIKTAHDHGAHSINYCEVKDFTYTDGKIDGVVCQDLLNDQDFTIKSKYVVSATGPWVDQLRAKNNSLQGKRLHLTKGVHLVVPHDRFPVKQAVYFDVPDGRMIFAIPRWKTTYIGTTDTDYHGNIDHVLTNKEDEKYLLDAVNHTFPQLGLNSDDVISSWAGLRPLIHEDGKSASELSRKDEIFESETGLISIAGGKLTGYRKMAQRIVDKVVHLREKSEGTKFTKCLTDKIVLKGGVFDGQREVEKYIQGLEQKCSEKSLNPFRAVYLAHNYGKQSENILEGMNQFEDDPETSLARSELKFSVEHELVATLRDFFERRTGRLYFDIHSINEVKDVILGDMKTYFGWDTSHCEIQMAELDQVVHEAASFEEGELAKA